MVLNNICDVISSVRYLSTILSSAYTITVANSALLTGTVLLCLSLLFTPAATAQIDPAYKLDLNDNQAEMGTEHRQLPASIYTPLLKTSVISLGLPDLLARLQAENLYIQQQETQLSVARANFAAQLIDPLPDVNARYSRTSFDGVIQLFGDQTIPVEQTVHEPRIDASVTLGLGGRQLWNILQARRDIQAQKAFLRETLQQQLANGTREFYNWHEAYLTQQAAEDALTASNEDLRRAEGRFRAGVGTKLEVMQTQSQVALRQQERFTRQKQLAEAEEALLNRLNLPIYTQLIPADTQAGTKILIHQPLQVDNNQWLESILNNHPEMVRLDKEERALRWQSRSILSTVLPDVTLSAYRGGRGPQLNNLGRITGTAVSIQTTLGNKLGLALPTQYIGARRLTDAKQVEIELAKRNLQSQVMQAILECQRAEKTLTAATSRQQAAAEAYRLATARQRVGVGTTLDTLTAASENSLAQANAATAIMDVNRAQVSFLEALGLITPNHLLYGVRLDERGEATPVQPSENLSLGLSTSPTKGSP